MDRSPGFGSTPTDSGPLKTWFPYGSTPEVLNLASKRTFGIVSQEAIMKQISDEWGLN